MKKFIAFVTTLSLLTPAVAMAQQGPGSGALRAEVRAQVYASTSNARPGPLGSSSVPKLGPAIQNLASTTRAQWKGAASTTREAVRAKLTAIHALVAQHKEAMSERAEAARTKAKERFGEHIEKFVTNISQRLASSSAQLGALANRADARIEDLQSQGFEMASSSALLEKAQTDLATANQKITAVNAALEAAMGTTTPKEGIPAVRAAVKAAQEALALVKSDLAQTLRAIRIESGATTTVSI